MANRVPRPKARAGAQVDSSPLTDPIVRRVIDQMQNQMDLLNVRLNALTAVVPTVPDPGEKDTISPRLNNLERAMQDRVNADSGFSQALQRKIVQVEIAELPTATGASDYFTAFILGVGGDGSTSGDTIKIAKPEQLRRTRYDGETYNGVAYAYSDNFTRTADGTTQTINPPYVVGDVIYAALQPAGGTDVVDENNKPVHWIDLNADGRHWANASSAGGFIIGKITGHTAGQAYTISLYGNGSTEVATATGIACTVINVSSSETLANDTWLAVTQLPGGGYEAIVYGVLV